MILFTSLISVRHLHVRPKQMPITARMLCLIRQCESHWQWVLFLTCYNLHCLGHCGELSRKPTVDLMQSHGEPQIIIITSVWESSATCLKADKTPRDGAETNRQFTNLSLDRKLINNNSGNCLIISVIYQTKISSFSSFSNVRICCFSLFYIIINRISVIWTIGRTKQDIRRCPVRKL